MLGNRQAQRGHWQAAQAAYAQALALAPRANSAFNLAVSLEHLGRTDEALVHYRAALAMSEGETRLDKRTVTGRIAALTHARSATP